MGTTTLGVTRHALLPSGKPALQQVASPIRSLSEHRMENAGSGLSGRRLYRMPEQSGEHCTATPRRELALYPNALVKTPILDPVVDCTTWSGQRWSTHSAGLREFGYPCGIGRRSGAIPALFDQVLQLDI